MNIEDLQQLGFTPEQLFDRVADNITERLLASAVLSEDGDFEEASPYMQAMQKKITARLDEAISQVVEQQILPGVPAQIEDIVIQQTNQWGEKKGEPVTFVEYLVERGNFYINEMVDYEGKTRTQKGSFGSSWKGTQTRLTHMIDRHLHYQIEQAMKSFLSSANKEFSGALAKTAQAKMQEISARLKVEVK